MSTTHDAPAGSGTSAAGDAPAVTDDRNGMQVHSAAGLLREANRVGVLDAADIHITGRLVRMSGDRVGEIEQLATALAVRAVRQGSTCLALADIAVPADENGEPVLALPGTEAMLTALRAGPLIVGASGGPLRPLVVMDSDDGPLLYLRKYFQQEQVIRTILAERSARRPDVDADAVRAAVDAAFAASPDASPRQRLAAAVAASRWTSVLTGGPGTGKTYTVARILSVLEQIAGGPAHVAVCAPTGRAVAQLQASLDGMRRAAASPDTDIPDTHTPTVHAVTVHGLLGWRPGSAPRYRSGNLLPHDVVVVDETSMLSITAMSHLLEAIRPDARLIFVGDPHQLASVEAGAVLADLVERAASGSMPGTDLADLATAELSGPELPRLGDGIVALTRNYRNRGGIADIASAVNSGDADAVLELLALPEVDDVELVEPGDPAIARDVVAWGRALWEAGRTGSAVDALDALDGHRVLCAHREGSWGVQGWSRQIMEWLSEVPGHPPVSPDMIRWEPGTPILVTANDRQNKVFNGDCGVVIRRLDDDGEPSLSVAFRRSEFSDPVQVSPARLAETMWAYAMTIHRSQGSQFGAVTVVLPPADSPLLTRELLYTAITRAKSRVRIVGTPESLQAAVERRVHRASGLRSELHPYPDAPYER
ncbi:exodeoxyribonuclease V subunit alpha [Gordonia sp. NB41Y]|uniref:exodeoxyribonuclease V subunit alpha n=1 Tax=Gordonia sp. NB41Y TaxID=875808 RepID=UPI0009E6C6F4|nr:exodeoxyribonuclease V subunit alpha [Gordonia sp. NB41Y]WLP90659.1 exodeoxyribonuclease V subunit alpha [Gordonia sp. NB41Y]